MKKEKVICIVNGNSIPSLPHDLYPQALPSLLIYLNDLQGYL